MSMVKSGNCWDTIPNGIPEDEEFDDILNILDFPMESLEDDGLVADWDISKSNCLGPIPSNVIMGPPTVRDSKFDTGPSHLSTGLVVPVSFLDLIYRLKLYYCEKAVGVYEEGLSV
ncbi:hypothetical protein OROGR_024575 [Orobanche gracilis]